MIEAVSGKRYNINTARASGNVPFFSYTDFTLLYTNIIKKIETNS